MRDRHSGTAANDVQVSERLQKIHVSSEYLGRYKSGIRVRDLPTWYLDEPTELGGDNDGPTPLETVLSALCGCTAMIVYILQREMSFQLDGLRCAATGTIDVRRVEMKRTGKKFSEVQPVAYHYDSVEMQVFVRTPEPDGRLHELRDQVARLCPVSRLLDDARVPLKVMWTRE